MKRIIDLYKEEWKKCSILTRLLILSPAVIFLLFLLSLVIGPIKIAGYAVAPLVLFFASVLFLNQATLGLLASKITDQYEDWGKRGIDITSNEFQASVNFKEYKILEKYIMYLMGASILLFILIALLQHSFG